MDAIDQTLQATEKLLKALQEDQSTLGDSPFGDRLSDLRTKHKETTDYLNRLWEEESRYHSVPHTTCRQWAVHHCSSERLADTCPYEVSASSRPAEFVIHHRPSEYTIHHRPSEYTIHQRPRGYTEENRPRPTTSEHHQSDYPGPPRPSEYPVYRSKAEVVGDFRSSEFSFDRRFRETSAQHIRSGHSIEPFTVVYPSDDSLVEYSIPHRTGAFVADERLPGMSDYPYQIPTELPSRPIPTDYSLGSLPPGYLKFQAPPDATSHQGPSYPTEVPFGQLPSTSAYPQPSAPSVQKHARKQSNGHLPPKYPKDHLSEDSLQHESPKSKSSEEGDRASRDQRQSISKTISRPKASSALPRTSVPTVHPRLRERVNSLPARPIVQDAADVLHLAEKAKAKKREERAREREKEKILEKVDENREESTQTLDQGENAISEKPISNGNRSNGSLREGSAPKEKPESETEEKPAKKKDKVNGHAKEKSSKKKAHNETKDKMKDDSSKRVEFLESEVEEVERTTAENDRVVSSDKADDGGGELSSVKARPPRPKSAKGTRQPIKPLATSTTKREVVPEPIQNFVPQITVPIPFKFATRKPIVNKYSTKFVEEMVSKKKEQEEEETQASKPRPFIAHAVPMSTYVSTNPRVSDKAYVEAIRRRLTATMRKHFEQEALRRCKSLGDLTVRPVPITTYVAPSIPDYRRSRSAHRRAVQLLVEATTPPILREHTVRTHVSTKVRHLHCLEDSGERYPRPPIPDFQRLHAEMESALKSAPHKPTTVPRPFHLSESKAYHHRHCKSSSPPRWRAQNIRKISKGNVAIRPTHSSTIRKEAIRKRQEILNEERHRSEKFWEDRRDEMDLSRVRLLSSMGSLPNVNDEIERMTAEKIRHSAESTREYEKFLAEMQQRVIDRPLIMEQQSIIAQKQKFTRKYEERLAAVGKTSPTARIRVNATERRDSDISGATYSVKSKEQAEIGENGYGSGDFDTDEETSGGKKRSSRSDSSSSSSASSSKSSSSKKPGSSGTSESSSS